MNIIFKQDSEWKEILSSIQFKILREGGTEKAFSGKLLNNKSEGLYSCVGCDNILYSSDSKFDSGSGWPSFYEPYNEESLIIIPSRFGIDGAEVKCARCGGHIGHVFLDGPKPTGLRFCMNSEVLKFEKN